MVVVLLASFGLFLFAQLVPCSSAKQPTKIQKHFCLYFSLIFLWKINNKERKKKERERKKTLKSLVCLILHLCVFAQRASAQWSGQEYSVCLW